MGIHAEGLDMSNGPCICTDECQWKRIFYSNLELVKNYLPAFGDPIWNSCKIMLYIYSQDRLMVRSTRTVCSFRGERVMYSLLVSLFMYIIFILILYCIFDLLTLKFGSSIWKIEASRLYIY